MERRRALGGHLPERRVRPKAHALPGDGDLPRAARRHRREGGRVDDRRVHAAAAQPAARSRASADGSCRSSPTRPVRSGSTRCSVGTRSTPPTASSTNPSTPTSCSATRSRRRSDPRGGHHRGRRDGELHRRGHRVRHLGRADDPVLHLLLDVRVPSLRRPDLGRRRHARPRVPPGRDGRPHHPARRRSPALRRPQPAASRRPFPNCAPTTPRSRTRWP